MAGYARPLVVGLVALAAWLASPTMGKAAASDTINPYPRAVLADVLVADWDLADGADGWVALNHCEVSHSDGVLCIVSSGEDPYLLAPPVAEVRGPLLVKLRMRSESSGLGGFYWASREHPQMAEERSVHPVFVHDGRWREYEVLLDTRETVTRIRLDPSTAPGTVAIDRMRLYRRELHPLEIASVEVSDDRLTLAVKNHSSRAMPFVFAGRETIAAPGGAVSVSRSIAGDRPFIALTLTVTPRDLEPLRRTVFLARPGASTRWLTLADRDLKVQVAADGSGARILDSDRLVGFIAPLVHRRGEVPRLEGRRRGRDLVFAGDGVEELRLSLGERLLRYRLRAAAAMEGPVVRARGALEQGLLCGVEYLGKGERSSSKLDLEGPEHLRFAPDPRLVTLPLMAFVTDLGSIAMAWDDVRLQPIFATPNFFDGGDDHRMSLEGRDIDVTLRIAGGPLEDAILWAVQRRGLPEPPETPRSRDAQLALCLEALEGPLRGDDGWGHVARESGRQFFSDQASTVWRLSDKVPAVPRLVYGGAHLRNPAIYLLTGRAQEWLDILARARTAPGQLADGSYRYDGPFRKGHFEDTASGHCAMRVHEVLEHARYTGDPESLARAVKTLEYMKRFRTPRGAQTWEISLHTPDILASAYLVLVYVRGHELTGDPSYLAEARRWAVTGLPFVYQWSDRPIMLYATTAVLGASNYRAPVWIGRPVQWCGIVYAHALALLAPHDKTLDWRKVARGILIAAEQMQYADGPHVGCLPDALELTYQERLPWDINPCTLVSLRLGLEGKLDGVDVAAAGAHRVVAPFPVEIRQGRAHVRGRRGVTYQVVIDGRRVVTVESRGNDDVPLAENAGRRGPD